MQNLTRLSQNIIHAWRPSIGATSTVYATHLHQPILKICGKCRQNIRKVEEVDIPGWRAHGLLHTLAKDSMRTAEKIESVKDTVSVEGGGNKLVLHRADGYVASFHGTWLRYNCHCSQCKQEHSGQRLFKPHLLQPSYSIAKANIQGTDVQVEWTDDDHLTVLPVSYLLHNDYSHSCRSQRMQQNTPISLKGDLPEMSYEDVNSSPTGVLRWLQHLSQVGICLVKNVPPKQGMLKEAVEHIWQLQHTIYGETFSVVSTSNPVNVAYSDVELGYHMDLMYYESPPGIQFLHCLRFDSCVQGGESVFVDSFHVAEILRHQYPEDFLALTRIPATFQKIHFDRPKPVHMKYQRPHIVLNPQGYIIAVNWSPPFEGPLSVNEEDVEPYYRAYTRFAQLLETTTETRVKIRLQPGELISFNNRRILHSRNSFELNGGVRHFEGCYLNIDDFKNQLNVLSWMVGEDQPAPRVGNHDLM